MLLYIDDMLSALETDRNCQNSDREDDWRLSIGITTRWFSWNMYYN
jgi:hypothetical protein